MISGGMETYRPESYSGEEPNLKRRVSFASFAMLDDETDNSNGIYLKPSLMAKRRSFSGMSNLRPNPLTSIIRKISPRHKRPSQIVG